VIYRIALGVALGLAAGSWVGATIEGHRDPRWWWIAQATIGGFQAWGATWILQQSGDLKKMWTAILLTGPVLASLVCIFFGEPFARPVLAATAVGALCAARAAIASRRAA
jgi:hypothetical protein